MRAITPSRSTVKCTSACGIKANARKRVEMERVRRTSYERKSYHDQLRAKNVSAIHSRHVNDTVAVSYDHLAFFCWATFV